MSEEQVDIVKAFTKEVGNIYNGSLFLSLISVLSLSPMDLSNQTLGMFSYGSGAIGEFFEVTIQAGYEQVFSKQQAIDHLENRHEIDFDTYQELMKIYEEKEKTIDFVPQETPTSSSLKVVLHQVKQGHRMYQLQEKK